MESSEAPAIRRTTTFSLTLMRLEKWVAMWRTFARLPCSTWSSRYSTPTAFNTQGVAVFRLSRNTVEMASGWSSSARWADTSNPSRSPTWAWRNNKGVLMTQSALSTASAMVCRSGASGESTVSR